MAKRLLDIWLALTLLVVTLPLQLGLAILVAVDLGRPVIFRQERGAKDGGAFELVKFRSMKPQPADAPPLNDEARVTTLGLALRRLRLDELPQAWLILRGDMSFVGPRPLYPKPHATENEMLFYYRRRVRPGMTGWAQVNGNTLLTESEKLALDAVYVDRSSVKFDLWILWLTVWTILRGERRHEINIAEALAHANRIGRHGREHRRHAGHAVRG